MILNRDDAIYAANVFMDYFSNFNRIDDYLRRVKLERMSNYPTSLPGLGPEDDMFSDFEINHNDMDFECREETNEIFVNYLEDENEDNFDHFTYLNQIKYNEIIF